MNYHNRYSVFYFQAEKNPTHHLPPALGHVSGSSFGEFFNINV